VRTTSRVTGTLVLRIAVITTVYVVTARLGLGLDAVAGYAALVWAPSGIALAAVLLFGFEVWPAIALGAFIANAWTGAPLPVAIAIAAGNTAEALVATYALHRVPGFTAQLDRLGDVLALLGLAGVLSTLISATVGVTSLVLGGVIPDSASQLAFRAWWLGDFIGIVLVVPVILAWNSNPRLVTDPRRLAEIALLVLAMVTVGAATFLRVTPMAPAILPVLIWAALRFGPRGAATASFFVAAIAIWATVMGTGPFVRSRLQDSLFALQIFLGILTSTFLVLSASFSERRKSEGDARKAEAVAAQANAAKAEFLAVMSHELRTPLNAISGYVDLLTDEVQGPITAKQRDSLARIQRNGRHLLSLIDDVLTFAKVEAGRVVINPSVVGVDDTIDAVGPLIQPELQRKRLSFVRLTRNRDLLVRADPERLQQILLNVLSNAAKYTPDEGAISIGAARQGTSVKIWVSDTGVGIPADQLPRVFEPFFQVERGTTRKYPGIGLGLTITRDLARAMGGDVRLESSEGSGTTIYLDLPAVERRRSGNVGTI
jgi:signal transduction histidine kinase